MRFYALVGSVSVFALVGCGGGGGSSPGSAPLAKNYGPVTATATGAVKRPVVIGSRKAVFTGVFGASFSSVKVNLPPANALPIDEVLAQTPIVYDLNGQPMLFDFATRRSTPIGTEQVFTNSSQPSLSGSGDKVAVAQWVHPTNQIFTQYLDGSDKKQITSGTEHAWHPAFSANGATVVFYRSDPVNGNYRLYKVPSGGGTATPITTAADNSVNPVFCENGLIAFYRQTNATGPYRPSLINLNGGQLTNVSSALTSTVPAWISFFPGTQNKEGLQVVKNGTVYQLWRFSQGVFGQEIGSTSAGLDGVSCSPVGNYALYFFYHDTNPGIYIFDSTNQASSLLIPGATARSPHWGAYTTVRNMVGTGSRLGATSGGFLFGQEGDIVRSFISFDATTRTSIDVTPQENPNPTQANAVCTITADSLTSLKYLNSMAGGAVTVLTPSTPASGAVVSFNADTGRVASVVPFNGNVSTRSASTYTGDFTGIWDSSGKNIAPSGAKAVEFDRSTGSAKVVH